jgi:hypothetical protein
VSGPGSTQTVVIRIERLPVALYREAAEHGDELVREFALIRDADPDDSAAVPRRLQLLIDRLTGQFSMFTGPQTEQLQRAIDRGDEWIDLVYEVPPDVKEACLALDAMLDEADEFCRRGKDLLTLATPPSALAFRKWFLHEFVRQADGEPPRPWQRAT